MFSFNCKGRLYSFDGPVVMGIVNTTPDSFFTDSRKNTIDAGLQRTEQMIADGATIIDLGGQSTRPGSERVPVEEELKRVLPAVEAISKRFPDVLLSIDTYYAKVAEHTINAGAHIVNDVSAGSIDDALLPTVADLKVPYVLMHMLDDPQTMQQNPVYENVVSDVFDFLSFKINELHALGIYDIIIDPGFGFGKTSEHNFKILKHLSFFNQLKLPVLAGLSRKGTICRTLNIIAEEALNGTTVLNTIALLNGASILRVHDVKEAVQAIQLIKAAQK